MDKLSVFDKAQLILNEIEKYLCFDDLQRKYANKAIIDALRRVDNA